jgi:WD40 repeat protein
LWHLDTLKQLHSFQGHQGAVACLPISPDGQPIDHFKNAASIPLFSPNLPILLKPVNYLLMCQLLNRDASVFSNLLQQPEG